MSLRNSLFFLSLFSGLILKSQTFNFRVFGVDEGLANPYVYHITQDARGFLYVGTGDGLSMFGGNKFENLTKEKGLAENFVSTQFIDPRGALWIGHFQKGLSVIKDFKILDLTLDELEGVKISGIICDKDSNIFIATFGKGVMSIGKNKAPIFIAGLPSDMVTDIQVTSDGKLLVATQESFGVYRLNPELNTAESIFSPDSLSGREFQKIIQRKKDDFFVLEKGYGLIHIKYLQGECRIIPFDNSIFAGATVDVRGGVFDQDGNLWLATFGQGIKKIVPSDEEFTVVTLFTIDHSNGLPTDHLQCVYFDREGNLWIGTYGKGLIQLINERFSLFLGFGNEMDPSVYSACSDRLGKLWIGTVEGLMSFTPGSKAGAPERLSNIPKEKITAVKPDSKGMIWVGTETGKLFILDPETGVTKVHPLSGKANYIHSITATETKMFVATSAGLAICTLSSENIQLITTLDGLLHNNVLFAFETGDSRIWIASHDTPPYYIYENEVTVFKDIPELKTYDINGMATDISGNIWIATAGDGLFRYDGLNFKNYSIQNGLGSNYCYSVICDVSGTVWVTHKNGVSRILKDGEEFETISKNKGFLSPENLQNAVYADPTGTIFFGTENGLIKYDPRKERKNDLENITAILGASLNGKNLELNKNASIPYGEYSLKFDFLGICLSDPSMVKYRYKLEGFDPSWTEIDYTTRSITYPKLTDGSYTFSLLSKNNTGMWNKKPVSFTIEIALPIWKRWYFFLFVAALLATVSILYTRLRTRRLLQKQELLKKQVQEQTIEIRKEKEEVERINSVVEEKNKDITSSINYAVKIQEAMLPPAAMMEKAMNGILFYRPRDIVSGDFFWFNQFEDGSMIVAAADCTGHGVPGAFVSLVGKMLLDKIIIEKKIYSPAQILTQLDMGIQESLSQKGDDLTSQDGMEISLLHFSPDRKKVTFSCANRPVLVVRKGELIEFTSSHFGIGGTYGKLQKNYVEDVVDVVPGDMLFIYSDGYADQFGGERGRKFSNKALKNLLTETANSKLIEQKALISGTFDRWKGDIKQLDDVLLIGIRI